MAGGRQSPFLDMEAVRQADQVSVGAVVLPDDLPPLAAIGTGKGDVALAFAVCCGGCVITLPWVRRERGTAFRCEGNLPPEGETHTII